MCEYIATSCGSFAMRRDIFSLYLAVESDWRQNGGYEPVGFRAP